MKREKFSQLPTHGELRDILEVETKRGLPEDKEDAHYFDFSPFVKLAEHFGMNAKLIASEYKPDDLEKEDLLSKGKEFVEELKTKILNKELSREDIEVLNSVYEYLAQEDSLEKADAIFVFGSKTPLRIEKAIELYEKGLAKTIVVSGKSPHYVKDTGMTEAAVYAKTAIDAGVPESAVILEEGSITIPDNVRASLNLLDNKGVVYESMILVNSPYTQRRGWAHFRKYTPDTVKFIRINSETGEQYKKDSWYKSSAGIDVIASEFFKAKVAVSLNTA